MAAQRTAEREEFLADVITTAIEGGIGYWSQTSQYQYTHDGQTCASVGDAIGAGTRAIVHVLKDDESGYEDEGQTITIDTVAKGLGIINSPADLALHSTYRSTILEASRSNDAGEIDAQLADIIVQVGLLGDVRYG